MLDRGWAKVDAAQDTWVENVDTGVNAVSDELDWLLDEAVNSRLVVWLVDNDSVFGWLLNLSDDNGTLVSVSFVECGEIGKWVIANDI